MDFLKKADPFVALPITEQNNWKKVLPRREIPQKVGVYSGCSVAELLKNAEEFAAQWNKKLEDVRIESSTEQEYYGHVSSHMHLEVEGLETDEQWHKRLWDERHSQEWRAKFERQEFERLKAKFGK